MTKELYRYEFRKDVPMHEVEATLCLALLGVQSLHGEPQARQEIEYAFDASRRTCVINASTPLAKDFSRLFIGYLQLEFGPETFRVERDDSLSHSQG